MMRVCTFCTNIINMNEEWWECGSWGSANTKAACANCASEMLARKRHAPHSQHDRVRYSGDGHVLIEELSANDLD